MTYKICICVDHGFDPPKATLCSVKRIEEFLRNDREYSIYVTKIDQEIFYIDWDREAGDEFPTLHKTYQGTPGERVVRYLPDTDSFLWGDAEDYQEIGEETLGTRENCI